MRFFLSYASKYFGTKMMRKTESSHLCNILVVVEVSKKEKNSLRTERNEGRSVLSVLHVHMRMLSVKRFAHLLVALDFRYKEAK